MNKKIIIIIICILSIFICLFESECIIVDSNIMTQIILTLLGIAFASYTFLISALSRILKKSPKTKESIKTFLTSIEKNLEIIFCFSIVIIFVNFLSSIDIPLINNPSKIDFGLFKINSIKDCMFDCIVVFSSLSSLCSFYDIMKSTFIILKGSFDLDVEI